MKKLLTLVLCLSALNGVFGQSTVNYAFTTGTGTTLADMSTGTTQLIAGPSDDAASSLANIGFAFYFMGTPYTQFSVNSNGQMRLGSTIIAGTNVSSAAVSTPFIVPISGDNYTLTTGKVHYKVTGTSPNQILVVEWKDLRIPYGTTGIGSMVQAWLYEGTGKIEFRYGSVSNNTATSTTRATFISSSNTANTVKYIGTDMISAVDGLSVSTYLMDNPSTALLNTRIYSFTPPAITPADPTTLTFTAVTTTTITPNWVDNSTDESLFIVTRATDVAFTQNVFITMVVSTSTATIGTAYNSSQAGLVPGTLYYYKIQATTEGYGSSGLTGSQATSAPGEITSVASGNWSAPATWSTNVVPTATDNVTIADGHTVIIDVAATCLNLTVGQGASGILRYGTTAVNLTVNGSVTVAENGTFDAGAAAGASLTHTLYLGGNSATSPYASNLTVNGVFDMYIGTSNGKATITFFGVQNSLISGTGTTMDFNNTNIINKGAITATSTVTPPVLDLQRTFTVQGINTLGFVTTHTAGTLKISGTFTQSNPVYTATGYSVPATGGIWLNNANYTVSGLTGSPTVNGLFKVTTGTYNIGTGSGNSLGSGTGSVYFIEGGVINVAGRFNLTSAGVYYNQSGGTLSVATVGNTSTANASFGITSSSASFIMSGGTIVLVQRNGGTLGATMRDYYVVGTPTITGGTLQVGSAATATNFNFRLYGYAPNTVIDNTTNNKKIEVYQTTGLLIILGNLTVNTGTTFDCLGFTANVTGNVTNNGIIQGLVAGSRFDFIGTSLQTYSGSGTFGTNVAPFIGTGVGIANTANVTLSSAIYTTRVNLFSGSFINSNQFNLGIGGTSSVYIQRGGGSGTPAGSFDVAPIFNVGSGGITLNYFTATTATTTGFEIPASRWVNFLTINNAPGVILSGGALDIAGLTMTQGNLTTTATNLLTIQGTAANAITYTAGFINGPIVRTLPAGLVTGSNYLFPVGKGTYNPFVLVNPTTDAGGTVRIQAEVFDANCGGTPTGLIATLNTNRYWAASITSGAAYFISSLIQLNDTPNGADAIAASATLTGNYDIVGGVAITATASSLTTTAPPATTTLLGFFAMGNKAAATLSNLAITPTGNLCTNASRTVTVTATPGGGAVTGVVIDYNIDGVAQTAITMTYTGGNDWSGVIPTVTPANANVTWSVTATDANLLTKTATGTPYKDEPLFGATANANASLTTVCSGSPTELSVVLSKNGNITFGSGTTLTGATEQPTAFCNRWSSYRMQTVYTAAELTAAGLSAGNITAIAYNITTLGDAASNSNFTVLVGTTSLTAFTNFISNAGFTTVFPAANYTHAVGINTITFTTPYYWDGVSNLVVEVSHDGADATNNSQTYYTETTGRNTVVHSYNGSATGTPSPKRLNIVFSGNAALTPSAYSWSDGATVVGTTNPLTVNPIGNTAYTSTVTALGCSIMSNTVNVTTIALPTPPTANNSTQCGLHVPGCSVTSTTTNPTPTFNWYLVPSGGTPIAGITGNTYTGPAISTTTIFYVTEFDGTCESVRVPVTATVTPTDAITAHASSTSVCLDNSVELSITQTGSTQAYTFEWTASPATGSGIPTSVSGSPVSITPTATGVYNYTVTATDGACVAASNISVTIKEKVSGVTANASQTVICNGTSIDLTSTPNTGTVTVLSENFNSPTNSWTTINNSFGGDDFNLAAWTLQADGYIYSTTTYHSNDNSQFYMSNSDDQGSGGTTATLLQSPAFSTIGYTSATLTFYHYYRTDDNSFLEYSTDGTNWTILVTYSATVGLASGFSLATVNLPAGAINQGTVYIRFRYNASWGFYWAIDNVTVNGSYPVYTHTWSSQPAGFTASVQNPTGVVPSDTTTYKVLVTNTVGCSDSATVTVNVNTSVGGTATATAASVCTGTGTTITLTDYDGTIQWQSSTDGLTFSDISGENGMTLSTGNLTAAMYYQAVVTKLACTPAISTMATVTVDPLTDAGSVTGGTTVCSGTNSTLLTLGAHTGAIVRWESSLDGTTWTPIVNTADTYTAKNLTLATQFRAVVQSGACSADNSGATTVSIDPVSDAGTVSSSTTVCSGTNSTLLTLGAHTGTIIRWESSLDGTIWSPITNTSDTYTATDLTSTTQFRAVVQSGVCSEANSVAAIVTVDPITIAGTVTGNATVCSGINSTLLTLGAHTGTIVRWESSLDGTTWTPIVNTSDTYTATNLTATTQFRAVVKSGVCSEANSVAATVTVDPVNVGGTLSHDTTFCSFTNSIQLSLSGNTGNVTRWESSSDGITWTPIVNTATTYTITNLTDTTKYRVVVQSGVCSEAYSTIVTINVNTWSAPIITASNNPSVCAATDGNATVSAATLYTWSTTPPQYGQQATGLGAGTYFVTVSDGYCTGTASVTLSDPSAPTVTLISDFTTICAGTLVTFTAGGATDYEFFVNGVSQGAPSATTIFTSSTLANGNTVSVKGTTLGCTGNSPDITMVVDPITVPGSVTSSTSVCSGTNSTLLTLGSYTGGIVRWESSLDGTIWTPIVNTNATYTATNLTATTWFRAVVKSGVCSEANSVAAIITVDPVTVAGTVTGGVTVCSGTNSTLLTLGAHTGAIVRWESSLDGTTWTPIVNTSDTFTATNLTATTQYRAVVQSGVCGSANSVATTVTVDPVTVAGTVTGGINVCSGINSTLLTLGAHTGAIVRWESSLDGTIWTPIVNTADTYTATNLTATTHYRAVVQSGVCVSANSVATTVTVDPVTVAGSVTGGVTVCSGTNSTLLTLGAHTGAIVRWESSLDGTTWTPISNTSATYMANNLTVTTQFRAVVQSGVCSSANSVATTVTVDPATVAGTVTGGTTVCSGINSTLLTLGTHTGAIVRWESSLDGTTWTPISNTSATYTANNLTVTTQYRAVVQSGVCGSANSVATTVTVDPVTVAGTVTGGATVCSGTNSTLLTLGAHTGAIVRWESSLDGTTWAPISNTSATYTANNLTVTTQFRAVVQSGVCGSANSVATTVTVDPATVAGTVTGGTTVCSGINSTLLTLGTHTGAIVRWESSLDGTTWTPITNTSATFTATNLTVTTQYRAVVQSGVCGSANSVATTVTVDPVTVAGTVTGGVTVCSGTNSTLLTLGAHTGAIVRWESSLDGTTWTPITNTSATFTATNLTVTTQYRAVVQSGVCGSANSVATTVTVDPVTVAGTVTGGATVCSGTNSTLLTLGAHTGAIVRWESSLDGTTWTPISNTSATYTANNLTVTTQFRAVVQSGVCGSANSVATTVTVDPVTVAGTVTGGATVCSGTNSTLLTLGAHTGTITGWESSLDGTTWTPIANTNATYTATNLTTTTQFRAVVQSGVCGAANSVATTVTVDPVTVAGTVTGGATVCSGTNSTLLALGVHTGAIVRWESSLDGTTWSPIVNTTDTYTATDLMATTQFRAVVQSGVCGLANSVATIVTVTPFPTAVISYAGAPFCSTVSTPQDVTLVGTPGGAYSASPSGLSINLTTGAITPSTSTAGTYTVTYTIAAAGGCSVVTAETQVTITTLLTATITYSGNPYCSSITTPQAVTLTGATGGTFTESPAGLTIDAVTGAITPSTSTAGTYNVYYTLDAVGGCSVVTAATQVTINDATNLIVDLGNDTTLCINQSILLDAGNPGASYLWTPGGQITQTKLIDSTYGLGPHTFSVFVTAENTCTARDTIVVTFDDCYAGIDENNNSISVSVYPNPSNGLIYLSVSGINGTAALNIFSMTGQIVYSEQVDNNGLINKPIDLKFYPKGMYFLRLTNDNITHTEKIIIE